MVHHNQFIKQALMVINSHTLSLGAQALILSGFDKPKVKDADSRSGST